MNRPRPPVLLGAALACGLGAGCTPEPQASARNVVMVVVDTLRADHLGCYGHERDTSPSIDALAAGGTRFDRAYSTAPWTMPSMASMITGQYPSRHGVTDFEPMTPEVTTLAEMFRAEGFSTGAVVSHGLLGERMGFDQGYESFNESATAFAASQRGEAHDGLTTGQVTRDASELLRNFADQNKPFFLFAHYFDPHYEYLRHRSIGWAAQRAGRFDGTESIHKLREHLADMTEAEIELLRDLYDEEIRFTDAGIGRLLATLSDLDLEEDTAVVFTADHGEEFVTRGWLGHTRTLFDELVRIPLILRAPGLPAGQVQSASVSLTSLAPTLLELTGVDDVPVTFDGSSLMGLLTGQESSYPGNVLLEVEFGMKAGLTPGSRRQQKRANKKGLVVDGHKLIRDDDTGQIQLFRVGPDEPELEDLAEAQPGLLKKLSLRLESEFEALASESVDAPSTPFTESEVDHLERLGYLTEEQ